MNHQAEPFEPTVKIRSYCVSGVQSDLAFAPRCTARILRFFRHVLLLAFATSHCSSPAQNLSNNEFNPNTVSKESLNKVMLNSFLIHSFVKGGTENEAIFGCLYPGQENLFTTSAKKIVDHYTRLEKSGNPVFFMSVGFGFRESPASLARLAPHELLMRKNLDWRKSDEILATRLFQLASQRKITVWVSLGDGSWELASKIMQEQAQR